MKIKVGAYRFVAISVIFAAVCCGCSTEPEINSGDPEIPELPSRPDTPAEPEAEMGELSNPSASESARRVYAFLVENMGKKIISGAMANVDNNNDFAQWVYSMSARHPAVNGYDLIQLDQSRPGGWVDYDNITAASDHWAANGLVSYMWHWRVPMDHDAYLSRDPARHAFYSAGYGGDAPVTTFDIDRALTSGTWENECILADIDRVAGIFARLRDAGIPVLWRPLHEAAGSYRHGSWFWWGAKGGKSTVKLWRLMYDRLVNHHKLNNLIWVWTAQYEAGYESRLAADYPGNDYVDVIGADIYANDDTPSVEAYKALMKLGGNSRLVALTETGRLPSPQRCVKEEAPWSWFMLWYTYNIHASGDKTDAFGNTAAILESVFRNPVVINREDMPSLKDADK